MRKVSIIGIGETKFGRFPERSLSEMISEAGNAAIRDAGVEKERIQAVYFGNFNSQYLCGQGHMGPMVTELLGLGRIPSMRVEGACASGGLALRSAYIAVAAGLYDVVIVGGAEKMCHRDTETVTEAIASAMDAEQEAAQGFTFPATFANIANRYFYEYRDVKKEMGMCAVNAHANACKNPDAQMPKELSLEKVLEADMIAAPFSLYDCSLVTDGSAFLVLAAADVIAGESRSHRVVDIVGSGHCGDVLTLAAKKVFTSFAATCGAADEAYKQSGLTNRDIDFAEVHDCFTLTQIINIEDLGFFEKGHGGDAVAAGEITLTGGKPINTSGGLKAKGHPIGATGVSQIYEIVTQIRGEAGERQIKKAEVGLAHNLGGSAGTCVVHILKGR
jgi:acetyl-CoA acetyltransferase